jgi:hypothetical protein
MNTTLTSHLRPSFTGDDSRIGPLQSDQQLGTASLKIVVEVQRCGAYVCRAGNLNDQKLEC